MNEMEKDFWINQVLENVTHGTPLGEALEEVPRAMRAEVRAAAEAALWLHTQARPTLRETATRWQPPPLPVDRLPARRRSWSARARARLRGWIPSPTVGMRPAWALLALLLLVVFTWQTAQAASHALPGDWAYPLKRTTERIHYLLTTDPAQRLMLTLNLADRRLEEASLAHQQHRNTAEEKSLQLYAQEIQTALQLWESLSRTQQEAVHLQLTAALEQHTQTLQRLHPLSSTEGWQHAQQALQHLQQMSAPWRLPRDITLPSPTPLPSPTARPAITMSATPYPTPTATATLASTACASQEGNKGHTPCTPPPNHGDAQETPHSTHEHTATPSAPPTAQSTPHHKNDHTATPVPDKKDKHGKP